MNDEFRIDYGLFLTNEGIPKWVTVFINGEPQWEELIVDKEGTYVLDKNDNKVYVFERNIINHINIH